jgi:hypothetical protein
MVNNFGVKIAKNGKRPKNLVGILKIMYLCRIIRKRENLFDAINSSLFGFLCVDVKQKN